MTPEFLKGMVEDDPDGFASHLVPLFLALMCSDDGPVLELGTGHWSTPRLHGYCERNARYLVSCENDPAWVAEAAKYVSTTHRVLAVHDWAKAPIEQHWSVVLVDNAPDTSRVELAHRCLRHADLVVFHDSEQPHYKAALTGKYRKDYTRFPIWATLMSNSIDVSTWEWIEP